MSRNVFIGDTLRHRKPRSKPDFMTTLPAMSDYTSRVDAVSSPCKGFEGCLQCFFCNVYDNPSTSLFFSQICAGTGEFQNALCRFCLLLYIIVGDRHVMHFLCALPDDLGNLLFVVAPHHEVSWRITFSLRELFCRVSHLLCMLLFNHYGSYLSRSLIKEIEQFSGSSTRLIRELN
jgi:hypothetical protein